jgi:hypothetical protein
VIQLGAFLEYISAWLRAPCLSLVRSPAVLEFQGVVSDFDNNIQAAIITCADENVNGAESVADIGASMSQVHHPLAPISIGIKAASNPFHGTSIRADEIQQVNVVPEERDAIRAVALRIGEIAKEVLKVELVA